METSGIPPKSVTSLLRLDGLAVAAAAITAFAVTGGNWWIFALLILAPDLSMLGLLLGEKTGAHVYNWAHSYTLPIVLGAAGVFGGPVTLLHIGLIWAAHIAIDRAVGYGLKYPHAIHHTHLGVMGKARKAERVANAG
ncbi:MAG TPA: DUF4260 domain-containing protein [Devosia sp.]|jgi:hypothetical protein|nr:DUF4260 domain-containing protein [Devosia sp.]